jgi:CDP-diacylglycerol--glycerol-3-phosphate 3-phosphatidyltransferase/cardiolipin synthase
VSFIGKVKTVAQMVAIPMLLYHDAIGVFQPRRWGTGLILLAAALTLWSMFYYLRMAMPTVLKHG